MVDYNVSPAAPVPANTWMPTTGGILSIIVGVMDLIGSLLMGGITCASSVFMNDYYGDYYLAPDIGNMTAAVFGFLALYLLILGLVSLIGGIFAVQRKKWGLAIAGAITAFFGGGILGILAIIFIAMGKKEFRS
jgi:hypothetical protein